MAIGNRGFMPIEIVGTMPPPSSTIKRLPLYQGNYFLKRNYCVFWSKERTNRYIEGFAEQLKKLLFSAFISFTYSKLAKTNLLIFVVFCKMDTATTNEGVNR